MPVSVTADLSQPVRNLASPSRRDMPPDQALIESVHRRPGILVATLRGTLDDDTVDELRHGFEGFMADSARTFALEMPAVSFVDSDGFGALIYLQKRLAETGRQLVLVGCQESVRLALSLTRLEILFPRFPSVEEIQLGR